jgi:putative DNA primase/helicase
METLLKNNTQNKSKILELYTSLGGHLFPCKRNEIGKKHSKEPLFGIRWQHSRFTNEDLLRYLRQGHALAWAIPAGWFVVDVDAPTPERPDKQGLDSLEKLEDALGYRLADVAALVVTAPTGGQHYYFRLDEPQKLAGKVKGYRDVEVRQVGNYILAAGCPHWQGGEYQTDWEPRDMGTPASLLDLIKLDETIPATGNAVKMPPAEVAKLLEKLNPAILQGERDKFIKPMAAVHSLTGGSEEGLAVWTDWATSDPEYAGAARDNRKTWKSLKSRDHGPGLATLARLLREAGEESDAARLYAQADFAEAGQLLTAPTEPPRVDAKGRPEREPKSEPKRMRSVCPEVIARQFLEGFKAEGVNTLIRWKQRWWVWAQGVYQMVEDVELRSRLINWLEDHYCDLSSSRISNVVDVLEGFCLHNASEAPSWIGEPPAHFAGVNPADLISTPTGVVNVKEAHLEPMPIFPATPRLFSTNDLKVKLAPKSQSGEPRQWLEFLEEIFSGDQTKIACLRQWFGLCLTTETRYQKMMLLIGPPRSGKGTINRILQSLLGPNQVASPTSKQFAGEFGLAPLVGKKLATISDMRAGRVPHEMLERFLGITGEDSQDINEKYRPIMPNVKLKTRLMILSNELPRFVDASLAINSRLIILRTPNSYLGREDLNLECKLMTELPAIFHWACEGYQELEALGFFSVPSDSKALVDELHDAASPVSAFVREFCEVGPDLECKIDDLFAAFRRFCFAENRRQPHSAEFGNELRAAMPAVERFRRLEGKQRSYFYRGLQLNSEGLELKNQFCF